MLKSRQSTLRRVDYFDDFFSVQVLENGGCHQNFQPLFIRFLYYNVQSLLGVIFDLVGIIFFLTDCSNFLLLFTQGMGKFPSASIVYCLYSSCVHNTPSLLGVNLNLDFCFLLDCLARSFFLFDVRGPRGGNLLQAMYRSIQI